MGNVRIKTRLTAAFLSLAAVIAGFALVAFFGTRELAYYGARSRLTHEVHLSLVELESNTYQLFKQLTDAVIVGGAETRPSVDESLRIVRADVDRVRTLIGEEVAVAGQREDELTEMATLVAIERKIDEIIREYEVVMRDLAAGDDELARAHAISLFDIRIDMEFETLINKAIAEEKREAAAGQRGFEEATQRIALWTGVLLVIGAPAALFMIFHFTRQLRTGFEGLGRAARSFAEGNLAYRISETGERDFDSIGSLFNLMAASIETSRLEADRARTSLENAVADRTSELQAANERLAEADGARRRLFADISHELRTPLTVIRGEAEIALRTPKDANDYPQSLRRVVMNAEQLGRLVDDLLFMARSDAGEQRFDFRSVAIVGLAEKAAADIETIAAERTIEIACHFDVSDLVVRGDAGRLSQVLMILLDNAVRYSSPGTQIRFRINRAPDGVAIAVEDDGIGVAHENLDRVFDRFYRGPDASRVASGSGLGLAVAKAIVEAHGGRIALSSAEGRGTTATVLLPVEGRLRAVS